MRQRSTFPLVVPDTDRPIRAGVELAVPPCASLNVGSDRVGWRLDWKRVHRVCRAAGAADAKQLACIIIPAQEAARFRDQLDLVSVDEQRLFPDLDGVAAEMRRYYS